MNVNLKYVNVKTIYGDEYIGIMVTPDPNTWDINHLKLIDFSKKMFLFYPAVPQYDVNESSVILRQAFPLSRVQHIVIPFDKTLFGGRITEEASFHYAEFLKDNLGDNFNEEIQETIITSLAAILAELEDLTKGPSAEKAPVYVHNPSAVLN